ncbi:class I SAM-dependent methyltransferase [Nioella aestuarii]|uniref:class I SAM-dependent methyltransferase n=1 Tax=Nioella aestuarii TaxID=1662864 RepID=UPI003D7FAE9E
MTATAAIFWDKVARKYAARPVGDIPAYEATLDHTRSYLKAGDRVLEIGCGTGSTAIALAPSVAELVATDVSAEMIEIGREKTWDAGLQNLSFVQAAADRGELPEGPFDAVLAFNALHLLDDLDAGLAEIHSLLAPGGLMISKTVCLGGPLSPFRPLIATMQLFNKAPHVLYLTADALRIRIEAAGFEITDTQDFNNSAKRPYFVARKR